MTPQKRASLKDHNPLDIMFQKTDGAQEQKKESPTSGIQAPVPEESEEATRQTTILLFDNQLNWLDEKCTEARTKKGKSIRKAVLIRSLIDVAMASHVNLEGLKNEEDLKKRIEEAIKTK